jgi:hypothetical protein
VSSTFPARFCLDFLTRLGGLGQTAPVAACGDCLQWRSLVVNNGGSFISGPAVVEIFDDNRPMFRWFFFPPGWGRLLFPGPEMAEDTLDHLGLRSG